MSNRAERIEYAEKNRTDSIYIIIEDIWHDHNISAIFRTAECAGLKNIFIAGALTKKQIRHNQIDFKCSRFLNIQYFENINAAVLEARKNNCRIFATYMSEDSKVLWAADFSGNIAFILGSEKQGISKAALELCDEKLWIPTFGLTRSLNVSVAAAVIIYEILRKKRYEYKEETNEIIAPFMKYKEERS